MSYRPTIAAGPHRAALFAGALIVFWLAATAGARDEDGRFDACRSNVLAARSGARYGVQPLLADLWALMDEPMPYHIGMAELVFEVVQEPDGGYCAECLTENIFTEGDTWQQLRENVLEATTAFFFDRPQPERVRLHLVRDEILSVA